MMMMLLMEIVKKLLINSKWLYNRKCDLSKGVGEKNQNIVREHSPFLLSRGHITFANLHFQCTILFHSQFSIKSKAIHSKHISIKCIN